VDEVLAISREHGLEPGEGRGSRAKHGVEGTFRVPPGGQLKSLQARVVEPGQATPKATRNLNLM
jgi:hypothetical protein